MYLCSRCTTRDVSVQLQLIYLHTLYLAYCCIIERDSYSHAPGFLRIEDEVCKNEMSLVYTVPGTWYGYDSVLPLLQQYTDRCHPTNLRPKSWRGRAKKSTTSDAANSANS